MRVFFDGIYEKTQLFEANLLFNPFKKYVPEKNTRDTFHNAQFSRRLPMRNCAIKSPIGVDRFEEYFVPNTIRSILELTSLNEDVKVYPNYTCSGDGNTKTTTPACCDLLQTPKLTQEDMLELEKSSYNVQTLAKIVGKYFPHHDLTNFECFGKQPVVVHGNSYIIANYINGALGLKNYDSLFAVSCKTVIKIVRPEHYLVAIYTHQTKTMDIFDPDGYYPENPGSADHCLHEGFKYFFGKITIETVGRGVQTEKQYFCFLWSMLYIYFRCVLPKCSCDEAAQFFNTLSNHDKAEIMTRFSFFLKQLPFSDVVGELFGVSEHQSREMTTRSGRQTIVKEYSEL